MFWNEYKIKGKRDNVFIESNGGSTFNQYEYDNIMVYLTRNLEELILNEVKDLMIKWINDDKMELVVTSIYGIRKYQNGAIVKKHIDICSTHIFGAVINIDQNVNEDWLFVIFDHKNNKHEILMQPQDIVLYEAASCSHSRPKPLNGQFYANVFIHFKPKTWLCPF